jgi:hypothetical protein
MFPSNIQVVDSKRKNPASNIFEHRTNVGFRTEIVDNIVAKYE